MAGDFDVSDADYAADAESCATCKGRGTFIECHGPGLHEELPCWDCCGTGTVPPPEPPRDAQPARLSGHP